MKKLFFASVLAILATSCSNDESENIALQVPAEAVSNQTQAKGVIEPAPSKNGDFIKVTENGNVFYCFLFRGSWRHVDSEMTWNGLFTSPKTFRYTFNSFNEATVLTRKGFDNPLFADNGLIRDATTGKIYFREGNTLRWIISMEIFNAYKFNMAAVQNVNDISNYTVLSDIN
ncbi:hypothetical protein FW781_09455 (plasmid) [Chryseobacterium panacisoli]|uniref:Lipoprotein n=1 Tax=Chryseobacterium panacisoli TaxID=1807141 RepID=A0A5D9A0W1_9FLAO|nr:hypothetical protein [Chryseobacterium panacisoli]TZG00133.1 hypothetical protein FW781_09455 [Chryseobacterium panacisoli]